MKTIKNLLLIFVFFTFTFSVQAQGKSFKKPAKEYPFNPDYPDIYCYGKDDKASYPNKGSKVFLEWIAYKSDKFKSDVKNNHVITFNGVYFNNSPTNNFHNGKSSIPFTVHLKLSIDEFIYYKDLIENKKYDYIILYPSKSDISYDGGISVFMHKPRSVPKI